MFTFFLQKLSFQSLNLAKRNQLENSKSSRNMAHNNNTEHLHKLAKAMCSVDLAESQWLQVSWVAGESRLVDLAIEASI
jgi:hypothetical protein